MTLTYIHRMPTTLHPLTAEKLRSEALPLKDRIMAWRFFNARGIDTTTRDGKRVAISGIEFSGSTQLVFWSDFFEPFMTLAATQTLHWVRDQCRERNLLPDEYLEEARLLIHDLVRTAYRDIARTDQLLRGNGFPDSVSCRDVSQQAEQMIQHINELTAAVGHGSATPIAPSLAPDDIVELKPNFMGFGVNLNALYRWFRRSNP
ncbi:hypothetical protein [Xanthomonas campestris]|uniref:hypothetical protein n=1 Tax=Xanthomonas campestris TaxID=339 RepID=UPI00129023D5|nr:hypothetical protein [Xanthomonas campestris]